MKIFLIKYCTMIIVLGLLFCAKTCLGDDKETKGLDNISIGRRLGKKSTGTNSTDNKKTVAVDKHIGATDSSSGLKAESPKEKEVRFKKVLEETRKGTQNHFNDNSSASSVGATDATEDPKTKDPKFTAIREFSCLRRKIIGIERIIGFLTADIYIHLKEDGTYDSEIVSNWGGKAQDLWNLIYKTWSNPGGPFHESSGGDPVALKEFMDNAICGIGKFLNKKKDENGGYSLGDDIGIVEKYIKLDKVEAVVKQINDIIHKGDESKTATVDRVDTGDGTVMERGENCITGTSAKGRNKRRYVSGLIRVRGCPNESEGQKQGCNKYKIMQRESEILVDIINVISGLADVVNQVKQGESEETNI